ncbi:MAG: DUF1841 family protein [Thiothrix sp.]
MFGNDRGNLRRYYVQCWQKARNQQPLDALEQQIAQVIREHPEYHALLENEASLQRDWLPEDGQTNPFLHMSLHLGIREQVATNRPVGIAALYQQLCQCYGTLAAEHRMMECLGESLWLAQRHNRAPDETAYLECLKKC